MRYISGPQEFANQTPTSHELVKYMINEPDILPGVMTLWKGEITPFSSLLAERGLTSRGLFTGLNNKNYRVVGSNHVQYSIQHSDRRLLTLVPGPGGEPYKCDAYPNEPGKFQTIIDVYTDSNWISPKDVVELNDGETLLYVADEMLPQEEDGTAGICWHYKMKVMTKNPAAYVDSALLAEGNQLGFVMTAFEHDLSETAYEKYTFDGWGHAYMSLQRMKYSISGTAAAMKESTRWVEHNGQKTWLSHAQDQMLRRWAQANEYANLFGKGTVNMDGDVMLKDLRGREIMVGDGIMNQGDGAFKFPYNQWTIGFLESIMQDMQIRAGNNGKTELALICGQKAYWGFQRLMGKIGVDVKDSKVVDGTGENKGINMTYEYYELAGVRVIPTLYKWFDSPDRPQQVREDGSRNNSWKGIFVSLGNATSGETGVELITLRDRMKMGSVSGIDKGGEMANSVDGTHHHILFQSGVILRNQDGVATIYRP